MKQNIKELKKGRPSSEYKNIVVQKNKFQNFDMDVLSKTCLINDLQGC